MKNIFLDKCRADKKMRVSELTDIVSSQHKIISDQYVDKNILKALHELPEKVKQPIILRTQGYSYEEISQMLNINRNTIGAYIFEARGILKAKLNIDCPTGVITKKLATATQQDKINSQIQTIVKSFPGLVGKRVKIFNGKPDSFWASAEVDGYSGDSLKLKNIEFFNHHKKTAFIIGAANICRIEIITEEE